MNNYISGHTAEVVAVDYLRQRGFNIIETNWKTRYCEIDIVAEKDNVAYLVEVKSRQTHFHGFGLDYITPKKLNQMKFAAELWVVNNEWTDGYQLAAIGIDADNITFIEQINV